MYYKPESLKNTFVTCANFNCKVWQALKCDYQKSVTTEYTLDEVIHACHFA